MLIKTKFEELFNVKDELLKDKEKYNVEIDAMLKQVEKLRGIWQGQDAKAFCDNMHYYVSKMKNIPVTYENLSNVINTANKGYKESDEKFAKLLSVEANNYDE